MQNRFFGVSTKWHVDQMMQLHTKKTRDERKEKESFCFKILRLKIEDQMPRLGGKGKKTLVLVTFHLRTLVRMNFVLMTFVLGTFVTRNFVRIMFLPKNLLK
jgi:hypothetical protein